MKLASFDECDSLAKLADQYGCKLALRIHTNMGRESLNHPVHTCEIAILLRMRDLLQDSFVHLVGQWDSLKEITMHETLKGLAEAEHIRIQNLQKDADRKIISYQGLSFNALPSLQQAVYQRVMESFRNTKGVQGYYKLQKSRLMISDKALESAYDLEKKSTKEVWAFSDFVADQNVLVRELLKPLLKSNLKLPGSSLTKEYFLSAGLNEESLLKLLGW